MSKDTDNRDQPSAKSEQVRRVLDELPRQDEVNAEMEQEREAITFLQRIEDRLRGRAPIRCGAAA